MIAVLLGILKWIGIILLGIIAFVLLMILMVLFCPFTYNISAAGDIKNPKDIYVQAKFGWFIWLVRPVITYENEKIKIILRLFGIPINLTKEKKKKKTKKNPKSNENNSKKNSQDSKERLETEDILDNNKDDYIDNNEIEVYEPLSYNDTGDDSNKLVIENIPDYEESFSEEEIAEFDEFNKNDSLNKEAKPSLKDRLKSKLSADKKKEPKRLLTEEEKAKIKEEEVRLKAEKKQARQDKINKLKEAYETFKKQETKDAIKLVKDVLIKILKHIMPRRYRGHINYGFEDPCTTGQVLAGIAAVYPAFRGRLSVNPYFDTIDMILNGDVNLRGRVVIIFFLIQGLKIWNNKTIRELIKKAR